jgi:hypothetical protein
MRRHPEFSTLQPENALRFVASCDRFITWRSEYYFPSPMANSMFFTARWKLYAALILFTAAFV